MKFTEKPEGFELILLRLSGNPVVYPLSLP